MDKKIKYLIFVVLITVVSTLLALLGELFPESLKAKITGIFPVTLSFETVWIILVISLVVSTVWLTWKIGLFDTTPNPTSLSTGTHPPTVLPTSQPVVSVNSTPNAPNNSPIIPPIKQSINMTKDEVLDLIATDLDKAFDELDKVFEAKGVYLDLSKEYFSRPDNFVLDTFRSKLKRFVNINWK